MHDVQIMESLYLFYTIQIKMVYWRFRGAREKKNKSADVIGRHLSTTNENAHRSHIIV